MRKDGVKGFLKLAVQRILKDCVIVIGLPVSEYF